MKLYNSFLLFCIILLGCSPSNEKQATLTSSVKTQTADVWTVTPTYTATPVPTYTPSLTPTISPTATITPTATATPKPTLTPTFAPYDYSQLPGKLAYMTFMCSVEALCTDLLVSKPDLSAAENITKNESGLSLKPIWSPLGRYIVYTHFISGENGMTQLRLYDFKTKKNRVLTPKGIGDTYGLSFSPDERYLVYSSYNLDTPENLDIFRIDLQTFRITNLTATYQGLDGFPSWSPDGEVIAFTSDRAKEGNEVGTQNHIWMMNPDGKDLYPLLPVDFENYRDFMPAWSPDGRFLAFYRGNINNPEEMEGEDLWLFTTRNEKTESIFTFTENFSVAEPPVWSPDGKILAVSAGDEEKKDIFLIMRIDQYTMKITDDEGEYGFVSWSPDSSALIYSVSGDTRSGFSCLSSMVSVCLPSMVRTV
jgi:Tol biopolymer transport system component